MAEIVTVGRTNYYTARKGTHHYRVAEGKRLTDTEHAWMVLKDQESGKNYFINGDGVRRWHLPDIFQTEEEREEELKQLKFKRDRRQARARGEKVDGEEGEEGEGGPGEGEDDDKKKEGEAGGDIDYGARDRAAAALRPNKSWDASADNRRAVIKYVKSILAPLNASGEMDAKLFSTVSTTVCREYFATANTFSEADRAALKKQALDYAKLRIDEKTVKEEYRKMNAELLAKTKRLDNERKQLNQQLAEHIKNEEAQKDEIFKLRAHKQDAILQSFKRLTRQGLTTTYWHRWKAFKATLDAQLHVKARKRRFDELEENNKILERDLKQAKADNESLNARVRRSEGRDVINVMLKQSGVYIQSRFYYIWKRWAEASVKEKQFHEMRQQLVDCPNCKQREVEVDRLKGRLKQAFEIFHTKEKESFEMKEGKERAEERSEAVHGLVATLESAIRDAQRTATELSQKLAETEKRLFNAEVRGRALESEIEQLQFKNMSLSDFSAADGGGGGGKGGGGGGGGFGSPQMGKSRNPLINAEGHLGHFMTTENRDLERRLRDITVGRAQQNSERAARTLTAIEEGEPGSSLVGLSAVGTTRVPPNSSRGTLNQRMEHAIAPNVVPPPPDDYDSDDGNDQQLMRKKQKMKKKAQIQMNRDKLSPGGGHGHHHDPYDGSHNVSVGRAGSQHGSVGGGGYRSGHEDSPPPPDEPYPEDAFYRQTIQEGYSNNNTGRSGGPNNNNSMSPRSDGASPPPPPMPDDSDSDNSLDDDRTTLNDLNEAMALYEKEQEEKENEKCEKCGFRRKLTPFCPKDGTRHGFTSLMMEPLVKPKVPTTAEEFTISLRQSQQQQEQTRLPPGLPPEVASGRAAYVRPDSLAAQLRNQLNLNPSNYDARSAQPARHIKNPMDIIRDPQEQSQIDEYIRLTKGRAEEARLQSLQGRVEGGLAGSKAPSILHSLRYDKKRDGATSHADGSGGPVRATWSNVFNNTVEGMEGNLRTDPVFGVVHSAGKKITPAENMLNTHTSRPNFGK